jgi:hypothetical protein
VRKYRGALEDQLGDVLVLKAIEAKDHSIGEQIVNNIIFSTQTKLESYNL